MTPHTGAQPWGNWLHEGEPCLLLVPHSSAVRHFFPNSHLAAPGLFCPHHMREGRSRALRTNHEGDAGSSHLHTGQHDAICTQGVGHSSADGIAHAHTHTQTQTTMVPVYSHCQGQGATC